MRVDAPVLRKRAMLMPLLRIRVGISSESASHTHTPGPTAKKPMKRKSVTATIQPLLSLGIGAIAAESIRSGAARAASRLPNGFVKNAETAFGGILRVICSGSAALFERMTFAADL